jgi:hypothetical protein
MKNLTLKQAQEKTIFYFDYSGKIKTMNLADFISESTDVTTSPRGVEARLHIREVQDDNGNVISYDIWSWGIRGNNPCFVESFETEEEAQEYLFKASIYDFDKDDQRDTRFFDTLEEAHEEEAEQYANNFGVKLDTAKSIVRKQKLIDLVR